jgi:FixJ family two-component response regulator
MEPWCNDSRLDADVWLREHGFDVPVVIITGRDDVKTASESR